MTARVSSSTHLARSLWAVVACDRHPEWDHMRLVSYLMCALHEWNGGCCSLSGMYQHLKKIKYYYKRERERQIEVSRSLISMARYNRDLSNTNARDPYGALPVCKTNGCKLTLLNFYTQEINAAFIAPGSNLSDFFCFGFFSHDTMQIMRVVRGRALAGGPLCVGDLVGLSLSLLQNQIMLHFRSRWCSTVAVCMCICISLYRRLRCIVSRKACCVNEAMNHGVLWLAETHSWVWEAHFAPNLKLVPLRLGCTSGL